MRCASLRQQLLLYAVTDSVPRGKRRPTGSLEKAVLAAIDGGASFVQLREKDAPRQDVVREALRLKALCARRGVPFVVDDDAALAAEAGADGVHVGQGDMSLTEARRMLGSGKIVGVSCQSVQQAVAAERGGADYLGVGAVFATSSKADAKLVSLETLAAICSAVAIPVVAIGGITADNVRFLQGSGVAGIAVISAIFGKEDIEGETRKLKSLAESLFC